MFSFAMLQLSLSTELLTTLSSTPKILLILWFFLYNVYGWLLLLAITRTCIYIGKRTSDKLYNFGNSLYEKKIVLLIFMPALWAALLILGAIKTIQRYHYRTEMENLTGEQPWIRGQEAYMIRQRIDGKRWKLLKEIDWLTSPSKIQELEKRLKRIEELCKLYNVTGMNRFDLSRQRRNSNKMILDD